MNCMVDDPLALPRDRSRFRRLSPEPRAALRPNPTPGFSVLTSIEMIYGSRRENDQDTGGSVPPSAGGDR